MERRIEYGARYPRYASSLSDGIKERAFDSKEEAQEFVDQANRSIEKAGQIPTATVIAREIIVGDWRNVSEVDGA